MAEPEAVLPRQESCLQMKEKPYLLQILRGSKHFCLGAIHGAWLRLSPPLPAIGILAFLLQYHSGSIWSIIHTVASNNHANIMSHLWSPTMQLCLCPGPQCLTLSYFGSPTNLALPPRPATSSATQNPFCRYNTPNIRSLTYSGQKTDSSESSPPCDTLHEF